MLHSRPQSALHWAHLLQTTEAQHSIEAAHPTPQFGKWLFGFAGWKMGGVQARSSNVEPL